LEIEYGENTNSHLVCFPASRELLQLQNMTIRSVISPIEFRPLTAGA